MRELLIAVTALVGLSAGLAWIYFWFSGTSYSPQGLIAAALIASGLTIAFVLGIGFQVLAEVIQKSEENVGTPSS